MSPITYQETLDCVRKAMLKKTENIEQIAEQENTAMLSDSAQ